MLKITVVAVGKLKEKFWVAACDEYLKRLRPYAKVTVAEIPDVDPARAGGVETALEREGAGILAAVPEGAHVILMAIEGKQRSSVDFSRHLDDLALRGASELAFVIGGSDGVSDAVRARADETFSFGPITLPHNLARVVLLEQLYRAFKISTASPITSNRKRAESHRSRRLSARVKRLSPTIYFFTISMVTSAGAGSSAVQWGQRV